VTLEKLLVKFELRSQCLWRWSTVQHLEGYEYLSPKVSNMVCPLYIGECTHIMNSEIDALVKNRKQDTTSLFREPIRAPSPSE